MTPDLGAGLRPDDPRQAGCYPLLARLGSGTIGTVYSGRSAGGRSLAVKVVHPGLAADPGFRLRFARDLEAARRVGGAFTVPVFDADADAPRPWLAAGLVAGPSLADAVGRYGPMPVSSVLTLAAGLAAGLGAVHQAGVAHGALTPGNVLLAADGPRLTDFGFWQAAGYARLLAGVGTGPAGFTPPGQPPGTPAGPADDVLALGAVLAFAAAGTPPYGLGGYGARPDLPAELRPLVEWCTSASPASRPEAGQLLAALRAAHPEAALAGWVLDGTFPETATAPARVAPAPAAVVAPASPAPVAPAAPVVSAAQAPAAQAPAAQAPAAPVVLAAPAQTVTDPVAPRPQRARWYRKLWKPLPPPRRPRRNRGGGCPSGDGPG